MHNTNYISIKTKLPKYLPFPAFLLEIKASPVAKIVYSLLLDRTTLSQKNGWVDENGCVYVVYPVAKIAKSVGCGITTIKHALNELSSLGLIERKRNGFNMPNRIFTKLPHRGWEPDRHMGINLSVRRAENRPLTTEYNNRINHIYRSGKPEKITNMPDYSFVEGESL